MSDRIADTGDIALSQTDMEFTVFFLFCASPQEEEPESHVPKLNFLALELSRSWVWKQLKDPLG